MTCESSDERARFHGHRFFREELKCGQLGVMSVAVRRLSLWKEHFRTLRKEAWFSVTRPHLRSFVDSFCKYPLLVMEDMRRRDFDERVRSEWTRCFKKPRTAQRGHGTPQPTFKNNKLGFARRGARAAVDCVMDERLPQRTSYMWSFSNFMGCVQRRSLSCGLNAKGKSYAWWTEDKIMVASLKQGTVTMTDMCKAICS